MKSQEDSLHCSTCNYSEKGYEYGLGSGIIRCPRCGEKTLKVTDFQGSVWFPNGEEFYYL